MGEGLYEALVREQGYQTRIYAPVGGHRDLLAYLVRRLLENGANSSFVHQLADESLSDADLIADPVAKIAAVGGHPASGDPAAPRPVRAGAAEQPGARPPGPGGTGAGGGGGRGKAPPLRGGVGAGKSFETRPPTSSHPQAPPQTPPLKGRG